MGHSTSNSKAQESIEFHEEIIMSFYRIAGLFISSYLWCTISGSGYDRFDRKEGIVFLLSWGFPGNKKSI